MSVASSWLYALAILITLAGLGKLHRPELVLPSLTRLPLPSAIATTTGARLLGLAECVVAITALAVGGPIAIGLVTASYLGFLVVSWMLSRHDEPADCGCFGAQKSPLTRTHVVVNAGCAVVSALALLDPPAALGAVFSYQPVAAIGFLILTGVQVGLLYLLFTALPALQLAQRTVEER